MHVQSAQQCQRQSKFSNVGESSRRTVLPGIPAVTRNEGYERERQIEEVSAVATKDITERISD